MRRIMSAVAACMASSGAIRIVTFGSLIGVHMASSSIVAAAAVSAVEADRNDDRWTATLGHGTSPTSISMVLSPLSLVQVTARSLRRNGTKKWRMVLAHIRGLHSRKWDWVNGSSLVRQQLMRDPGPLPNITAAEMTGVKQNTADDLPAFISALVLNCVLICVSFTVVSKLRQTFPAVYSYNVLKGRVSTSMYDEKVFSRFFGWWTCSWNLDMDEVTRVAGLDQCQLLEFANMSMTLLGSIAVPLIFILCPLHWAYGGNQSNGDYLSKCGMGNVVNRHSYLFYVHAMVVWAVVIATQRQIFAYMKAFLTRRKVWLMTMPAPRSTTVLVEGIPPEGCSDEKLKAFFDSIFARQVVAEATIVKKTKRLVSMIRDAKVAEGKLEEAKFQLARGKSGRPVVGRIVGKSVDAIDYYTSELTEARKRVESERQRLLKASPEPGGVNSTNGFVTFKTRRDAEVALRMTYTCDEDEYVVSLPPDPSDVIYTDFQRNPDTQKLREKVGYLAILGVFWAYMPCVIAISTATSLEDLGARYPKIFEGLSADPATVAMWDGMVASLVLQLCISFVPTFLVWIFLCFFLLKADAWLQHCVQTWYFHFLVVFVLLVTCVGNSLLSTINHIVEHPTYAFVLPARAMPTATHFYLNYLCLQCVTHAQTMMRTAQLAKFLVFRAIHEEERAKELAEPENQDYNGIGSRSARFAFLLVLVLVFCTLSPLMAGMGYVNFFIIRVVYGYLLVFAETKKPDLGGAFWYTQLKHVQQGMLIYIVLMTGVLLEKSASVYPGMIAGTSLVFLKVTYDRFHISFSWQQSSMEDLSREAEGQEKRLSTRTTYVQPELVVA
eukprot:TRINITY_DN37600_c0_g1_i1.p1 TRINITY_DN37600_c0_g1~~TRINITY_DN37600_c0_g1_i1.p1  ORF type:complete len:834 (-),score=107.83 TRINITY_DN37600_c0_g1_i1:52-2553(-)